MTQQDRLAQLEHRLGIVEDVLAIRNLQHAYGYYLDKCLYDEVVDLFADDGQVIFIGGVYKGRTGIARLYTGRFRARFTDGTNGPAHGRLLEHPQLQDIVHISDDRQTAYARFRTLMQGGTHHSIGEVRQWWEGGLYENTYAAENGVWKIKVLYYRPFWHATFEQGWAYTQPDYVPNSTAVFPEDPNGPDDLLADPPRLWPDTTTFPFHYRHPVTGKQVPPAGPTADK